MKRQVRYHLLVPLKRSIHPPEHTARGVMVGLFWALTPTVGIQMPLCFVTWIVGRRLFRWDFSVLISMAWTWVTNVVTMVPVYYLFYLTGQVMLGHYDHLTGYGEFTALWQRTFGALANHDGVPLAQWLWPSLAALFHGWGLPMLIGCVPWAAGGGWLGYVWSLKFVRNHREAMHRRRLARLRGRLPSSALATFLHDHDPFHRQDGKSG